MRTYLKIFNRFILRALARDLVRSSITVLGISLGVGVMIAIRLANASALDSFRTATESIAGETSLQVTGAAGRFDEERLRDLGWLREYGAASPVIEGYAMTEAEGEGEFLQVLGVDVLRDRKLRSYQLLKLGAASTETVEVGARDFLLLLADPQAIVLTEKFARRRDLSIGDKLPLIVGDSRREFIVRGLLLDQGPARALDGNFALMDIAAAQWAFDRIGLLDRLDIKLKDGLDPESARAEIASRLPAELTATSPESSFGQVEKMISAFHFNLNALGSIALLVGLFLIYNTISISVITRRGEIGMLRAVGTSRKTVLALFLGEAWLLAVIGTLLGLVIGRLMAGLAVRATATTVETFYIAAAATESVSQHSLGLAEALFAFAVALPLALIAAMVPALEASRVRPIEAMRGAERLSRNFRPSLKHLAISIALFVAAYLLSRLESVEGLPVFGYLAGLALMFGGAFLVPNALWIVCEAQQRVLTKIVRLFRVEARLASANLRGAISRVAISVAALAVSLAMMVSISVMIGSFRETVAYWVDQTLKADIYARPIIQGASGRVADEALQRLRADPQVAAVDLFVAQRLSYQNNLISLGAGDFQVLLDYGRLMFKSPADALGAVRDAIDDDAVVVSESFSLRFNKQPGDTVELPTRAGPRTFKVAAVYYDYSSNRGSAVMDRATYARHFLERAPSSLSIYLKPDADPAETRERLAHEIGGRYRLIFTTNGAIREEVVRIFNSTFRITYALELIAIVVAGLGVISTLITLILERRSEIAVLSFLGATRAQIRRMIIVEAILLGGVSQVVGIAVGLMLSLVLIFVINVQSFGWTIQFHMPIDFLIQSTLLIIAVTALAGLYPATRATRVEATEHAREE